MKNPLTKWLAVLLIAALLLTPVAMMEEAPAGEPVAAETETPTEDAPEDVLDEAPEETDDVPEAVLIPEAVDAAVTEEAELALDEAVEDAEPGDATDEPEGEQGDAQATEAQVVEESLDDIAQYEAAEEAPAPEGEPVAEETAEESAKAMVEAAGEIPIDEAHFPDAGFRQFIADRFDMDENGSLSDFERSASMLKLCEAQNISNKEGCQVRNITPLCSAQSLQGIEYFPNLTLLDCAGIGLTNLDLSKNTQLKNLWCENNNLTSLNLSGCTSLIKVYCTNNRLGNIYISSSGTFAHHFSTDYYTYDNQGIPRPAKRSNPKAFVCDVYEYKKFVIYELMHDKGSKIVKVGMPFTPTPGVDQIACAGRRAKAAVNVGATFQINPGAKAGKKFKSSKKKVATVSANGIVTAKAKGKTKITFKVGKKQRTLTLTVTDPTIPTSVALQPVNTAVKKGESVTLTPVVPEGTNPGGYKWKSSNKKVASVKNGVVTFKKKGKVTITCTAKRGKKKVKIRFKVSK